MKIPNTTLTEMANNIIDGIDKKDLSEDNYLNYFSRQIDPIILGVFYGLYTSRKLPPLTDERIQLKHSKEFGADISIHSEMINHLLFCLWLDNYGFPEDSDDILKYREILYEFISYIIKPRYYRDVLIPYYLKIASEDQQYDSSFMWKLWNSGEIGVTNVETSPEFISLTFHDAQESFLNDIVRPIQEKMSLKH